jgi:HlyD family secretion protein
MYLFHILIASLVSAADAPAGAGADKPAEPPTHAVAKEPFCIELALDGVFEAERMAEVALKIEDWPTLKVVSAVDHGARVSEGDVLLTLDTEGIDRAIDDLRRENRIADLAKQSAELALKQAEEMRQLDLEAAERATRQADEDLRRYVAIEKPLAEREAHFGFKRMEQQLAYEQEELKQLEKMYKADDLTEETEEIVLTRQRDAVESAQFALAGVQIQRDKTLQVTIPRAEQTLREAARRAALAAEKAREEVPRAIERQRIDGEKMKLERARAEDKLAKLVAARAAMIVKAPIAGTVYYGSCARGVFGDAMQVASRLEPGSTLTAGVVQMTIVRPRPVFVRATVPEKELHGVRAGVRGTAAPNAYPDLELALIVRSVEAIPLSPGNFGAQLTVEMTPAAEPIVPGMTCRMKLFTYERKDALTVPLTAVVPDARTPRASCAFVLGPDGKPAKRAVEVGRKTDKKVEIIKGLAEGDKVLITPPSAAAEAP